MDGIDALTLPRTASLQEAMSRLSVAGIVLVVEDGRLVATLTDGDVRRAILGGYPLDGPVAALLDDRAIHPRGAPVTAPAGSSRRHLLSTVRAAGVRQIPIVDAEQRPVAIVRLEDLLPRRTSAPRSTVIRSAVIMAGGEGRRLLPLTESVPKPMLPVNGRPLLERIVDQLRIGGITHITLTVRYLADVIVNHFGDGSRFGVTIDYTHEDQPMGTGGALSLLHRPRGPVLVMNGDILTDVSLPGLFRFHAKEEATITLGVRRLDIRPPYGIVDVSGVNVVAMREKPTLHYFVNAGLYLLDASAWDFIAPATAFDMPDLVQRAVEANRTVVAFPIGEEWIDIGEHSTYRAAAGFEPAEGEG